MPLRISNSIERLRNFLILFFQSTIWKEWNIWNLCSTINYEKILKFFFFFYWNTFTFIILSRAPHLKLWKQRTGTGLELASGIWSSARDNIYTGQHCKSKENCCKSGNKFLFEKEKNLEDVILLKLIILDSITEVG
jgi:hypothetical protein